jgi:hypothetical protein
LAKVFCTAVRPSTQSSIEVLLPDEVVEEVEKSGDITKAADWIGNEFNWQFIPL